MDTELDTESGLTSDHTTVKKKYSSLCTSSHYHPKNEIIQELNLTSSCPTISSYLTLPATISEARVLAFNGVTHPGMNMVGNSLKAHRASNEAIIFLYGITGSGKSSTLNHLFDKDLLDTSDNKSCTKDAVEYVVTMTSKKCKITNLEIGFIDVPGWGDTDGNIQDAVNLNTISKFTQQHPHLSSKYLSTFPNIVLIVLSAVDKRLGGEKSNCAHMLKAVSKLRIVDKNHRNVVFVLTHANAIPKGRYKETKITKTNEVQALSRQYLGVPSPVVWIENDIKGNLLDQEGDWTLLYDKERQPYNLFQAMISLMKENKDDIGREAVRIYFSSGKFPINVKMKRKVAGRIAKCNANEEVELNDQEMNWHNVLMKELSQLVTTEITRKLRDYTEHHKNVIRYQEMIPLLFYLQEARFKKLSELESKTLQEIENDLRPFLLSKTDKFILFEVFKVQRSSFEEIVRVIGCGYNMENNKISTGKVFNLNSLDTDFDYNFGVYIPRGVELIPIQCTVISCEEASCTELTTCLDNKVISFDIIHKVCIFSTNKDFTKVKHSEEFLKSIQELPTIAVENNQVNTEYEDFFKKYGQWEIQSMIGSGRISGNLTLNAASNPLTTEKQIRAAIEQQVSMIKEEIMFEDSMIEQIIGLDKEPLVFAGGDPGYYCPDFQTMTLEKWNAWVQSIIENPIFCPEDFILSPIYNTVEKIDSAKGVELQKAYNALYSYKKPELKIQPRNKYIRQSITPGSLYFADIDQGDNVDTSIVDMGSHNGVLTRDEASKKEEIGEITSCFPGNATVVLRGGERVRMDELKIGDYVLSIHPTTYRPVYSKVYLWAHRDPHITATFLHITHPHGHLHISANHLILTGDNNTLVPAHQLRVGDSIHLLYEQNNDNNNNNNDNKKEREDSHTLISVNVLHIHTCTQLGYYTPFTMNGCIVVDGIAASVFSLPNGSIKDANLFQSIGHTLFYPIRLLEQIGLGVNSEKYMNESTKIHRYAQFLHDSYEVLTPLNNLFSK